RVQLDDRARHRPDAADGHDGRRTGALRAGQPLRRPHRRRRRAAGRGDGAAAGAFRLRPRRARRQCLQPRDAVRGLRGRSPRRALAVRLVAAGLARQPFAGGRDRSVGQRAAGCGLHAGRCAGRYGRRAARTDDRLRVARRPRLPPQRRRADGPGDRWCRLAVRRPGRRDRVEADARLLLVDHAVVLDVLDRRDARRVDAGRSRPDREAVDLAAPRESAAMSELVLRTHDLTRRFGALVATDHVSLAVERGARHALIGPNGAGKTTLVNLLTGVLAPSGGRIELLGEDVTGLAAHRRVRRGLVRTFQINQLFATFTPLQSLALAVSARLGVAGRWWRRLGADRRVAQRCDELLAQLRLADVATQAVRE